MPGPEAPDASGRPSGGAPAGTTTNHADASDNGGAPVGTTTNHADASDNGGAPDHIDPTPGHRRTGGDQGPEVLRLLRFDRVQRSAHWANAILFGVLVLTGLPLYFPSVERVVGRHVLLATVHLWAGVALPVPVLVALVGPWGGRMRADVRRWNRWTRDELVWITRLGRTELDADKFNPGQKLNGVFVGGAIVVFLLSGVVMHWFGLFPVGWRTGATFVHEVLAFVFVVVVTGHVVMALTHPDTLRSMVRGWVTVPWAQRHAPRWAREETARTLAQPGAHPPPGGRRARLWR